jgi:hypothetical protein
MTNPSRRRTFSLPLELARQVDQVCDHFEEAWQAGNRPKIEDYLTSISGSARSALLAELFRIELCYRRRLNESPHLEQYLLRFGSDFELLRTVFEETPDRETHEADAQRAVGAATCTAEPLTAVATTAIADDICGRSPDFPQVKGYEILGILGQGGMGIVYKARQLGLNRLVALKMPSPGLVFGSTAFARFRAEAEAVARFHDPHIVQIYEIGEIEGHPEGYPYFSLEYIDGGSLADNLKDGPWAPDRAARLVEVMAQTIHKAHACGLTHRDVTVSSKEDVRRNRRSTNWSCSVNRFLTFKARNRDRYNSGASQVASRQPKLPCHANRLCL